MNNNLWSIKDIWNDTITQKQRELKVRNYIWAGDIGKNFYDRYLKMNAVPPDTPIDYRVLRKFSAGIWFEEQIGYILKTIGILKSKQEWIEIPENEECLRITGKLDYIAGGLSNWNEARERVTKAEFPNFIEQISYKLIDYFERQYPVGLIEKIVEVKSVNSQVFWEKKDYLNEAYPHHELQLFTYLRALKKPLGTIFYISKDDLTVEEFVVELNNKELEEKWLKDVKQMTKFWREKQEPPKPEEMVYDPRKKLIFQFNKEKQKIQGCYVENWQVKWSDYFKRITGCQTEDEWIDKIKPIIASKNEELKVDYKNNLSK
jgi:hypothetical protein